MDEIIERLEKIEIKLDALLYLLSAEDEEMPGGDEHGTERDQAQTL